MQPVRDGEMLCKGEISSSVEVERLPPFNFPITDSTLPRIWIPARLLGPSLFGVFPSIITEKQTPITLNVNSSWLGAGLDAGLWTPKRKPHQAKDKRAIVAWPWKHRTGSIGDSREHRLLAPLDFWRLKAPSA